MAEVEEEVMMKPQWINNTFIGPFWMGTPEEIARTQEAIDEATHEITDEIEDLIDESINTEIGETHNDRQ